MSARVDLTSLFSDLIRFETELWNRVDAAIQQAHGVPLAWIEILRVADSTPQCRVLDITRALSITVGGASKIVDRVAQAGLCQREPNPADGRSSLIRLSTAGGELVAKAGTTQAAVLDEVLAGALPSADLLHLEHTVRALRRHLTKATTPEVGP